MKQEFNRDIKKEERFISSVERARFYIGRRNTHKLSVITAKRMFPLGFSITSLATASLEPNRAEFFATRRRFYDNSSLRVGRLEK